MGVRAERKKRRAEKVAKYADKIADGVNTALETDNVKSVLALSTTQGEGQWDIAFARVVTTETNKLIKSCPQEKELIREGMKAVTPKLDPVAAYKASEVELVRIREEEKAKREKAAKKKAKKKEAAAA